MKALLLSGFGIDIRVDGRKLVIDKRQNNEKMVFHPHQIAYDNVMLENIRLLAKFLENDEKVLNFEIPGIKPYRDDDIELRNKITSFTQEDRKQLKINKSTLWYRQKKIKENKALKVCNRVGD